MDERREKLNKIAGDVMRLSRNTLLVHMRFLDAALSRLTPVQSDFGVLFTDGKYLGYDPVFVLRRYREAPETPVRDYLHIVMHCVFRHMFIHRLVDRECWDLACDIAVENMITDLGMKSVSAPREAAQKSELDRLRKSIKLLTAEKIYRYLLDDRPNDVRMKDLKRLFSADDHSLWYVESEKKKEIRAKLKRTEEGSAPENRNNANDGSDDERMGQDEGAGQDGDLRQTPGQRDPDAEQDWSDVSKRMEQDLKMFAAGKHRGKESGDLIKSLEALNREKYDYTSFLKKFAVLGETMKINDDEFDYIFYTYGLKLYKKMPLIEPLEYKDVKRIREFVIAIDTSGSTSGELVQRFLQKTYNILHESESFFKKINLHILQCDTEIKEDAYITDSEEFERYIKTAKIHGHGGTDFRPVFEYVDMLRESRQLNNLKGLIYFTDGHGVFPARKPEYETAFVFVDDDYNNYDVPPWAIKLILPKDDI